MSILNGTKVPCIHSVEIHGLLDFRVHSTKTGANNLSEMAHLSKPNGVAVPLSAGQVVCIIAAVCALKKEYPMISA